MAARPFEPSTRRAAPFAEGWAPLSRMPKGVLRIAKEAARHLLRRPVVGIATVARGPCGRYLLVRRTDTGTWALPGGTLEWGEDLRTALARELQEEAGVTRFELERLVGVYSAFGRDPRFHAVTVVAACRLLELPGRPMNRAEIAEVRLFHGAEVPRPLAHGMDDMLTDGAGAGPPTLE